MKLNIIGNGFDLYHGLPSSYYHFCCYLIEKDHEFFETLSQMYNFKYAHLVEPSIGHDFEHVAEDRFWSYFECQLGKINESYIFESLEDDLRLENNDPVAIEMNDHEIALILKDYFNQWVMETLDKEINYDIIRKHMSQSSFLRLSQNDRYLSFNYTHILQNLYAISNESIFYIHGESSVEADNEIVVGHGDTEAIEQLKTNICDLQQVYNYKQSSMNRITELECLLKFTEMLKKNVSCCILQAKYFFNSLENNVDTIRIYGLSLGEVDVPYLEVIRQKWPAANWEFSFHEEKYKERIDEITKKLGIDARKYSTFKLSNNNSYITQNKIIEALNIKLVKRIPTENVFN